MTAANLLLIGDESLLSRAIGLVNLQDGQLLMVRRAGGDLSLPVPPPTGATLVLHDVDRLSARDQDEFLVWLDAARGRTRVISTAAQPLFPAVFAGAFSSELYYRLNTLRVDLRA